MANRHQMNEPTQQLLGFKRPLQSPMAERDCICHRPKTNLKCLACQLEMVGRVRTSCPRHPMTIYLMDLELCPRCFALADAMQEIIPGDK